MLHLRREGAGVTEVETWPAHPELIVATIDVEGVAAADALCWSSWQGSAEWPQHGMMLGGVRHAFDD